MHIGSGAVATIHATQSTMTDARRPCVASKVLAVLSLLSLVSAATNPVLQTEVERDILIALYQNTAGESWTNNNNWNSPEIHVCDWEGISCISPETSSRRLADQVEDTRSVQRIDLSENNLQGSAPLSLLLLLPNIQSLLLNGNNVDYSKMAQQEKETLGTVLDISNVTVTSSVQHLDLSLTTVDSLSRVFTAGNGLTQIHTPYLTDFYASQAQIRGPLPAFLMETHTLERLELGHNEITGTLPMTVGNLRNLKYLNIADNSLQGTLPNTVNQLGRLRYLLAEKNGFTGTIPIGLTSDEYTPLLEQIDLSDQRSESTKPGPTAGLSGPVPAFATQKRLRRVDLGVNSFTGPVPASLLSAVYFADFDFIILGNNLLTGAIPSSVLQRIPAGGLFLENNKFTAVSGCPISVYGCSAILCPPLSYEPRSGRQEEDNRPCLECLQNTKYWGQTQCKLEENTPTAAPVPATPKPTGAPVNTPTTKPPTEAPVPTRTPTISPSDPPDPVYVDERAILLELYTALGGKSWTKAEGWSTPTAADTFCAWHGVVCVSESDRSVKFLHLDSNNLNGSIPSSLYSLPSLESLDLSHNVGLVVTFQGIGNARSLQALDLSSTTIDSIEALVNVAPSLQELYMSDVGGFDSKPIPDDIFKLSNLRQLVFDYNNAVGALSEELGQLSRLVVFSAANNELSGPLPQSLSKLTDLTSLRLTTNHFSGTLPSGFDMLTSLAIIDLSNQWSNGQDDDFDDNGRSGLTGTLPSFANFTQLRRLDLGVNSLSGSIPMAFLAGVDTGDGGLFEFADVGSNFLTGTVPSSLGRLRNVYMQDNKISGIDPLVCNSLPATLIAFGCNAVLCSPASYSQLGRQVAADQPCSPCGLVSGALYYGSTECTSTVQYPSQAPVKGPTSIPAGNVMARTALELIYDECGGKQWSFPANWKEDGLDVCLWDGITCSTQREVISISLRAANLVGTFPSLVVFRNLPALRALVLDGNSVAFSFDGIDAALNLDTLDLTSTELDSVDGIEGAPSLKSVYLASNNLRGEFPTSLLQLTNLERLALAFNTLSKNIPGTINLLTNLEFLSLHDNKFTGTIPTIFGQMNNLFFLLLQSNSLTGPIPTQLNLLTKMRFMDLSSQTINGGDGLSGKLPSFSALGDLKRMTLNGNSLAGSIPSDFLDKATPLNFEHLDLSDNKLTGTVPSTLSKFPAEQYDVTNNRFSAIDSALCDKKLGGIIEAYGCDSILCPRGEYNSKGRQILDADKCESCPGNQFFGMTTCGDPPTQAPVAAPEISAFEVLSKLYDATTGNFWRRKDHWKQSSISVCEWYGVTCSVDGVEQVEDIVLSSNNLDGTVPQEIFQLPYLKSLVLDSNFISMQDLGRIYDAPQLQILDLSNTEIKDVVGIGKARALQELHIKSNDLQGVLPVEIFDIFTLEQLDFDFCAFSGTLGSGIGRLTNLKFLGGDKNQLSGTLPKEMDTLTNLVTMKLGRNSFTGSIPSSLNLLVSITLLDLSDQTEHGGPGLSGKLPALDGMERLTQLILKSNAITGAIPANFLQGVNPDVFEYADLSSNAITGSIPSSLAMLSHVHLHDNLITGVASEMCAESRGVIYKAFGCNAVLCPPKTYSPHGRQESEAVSCMVCEQATLWGTTSCPPKYNNGGNTVRPKISERDVLLKFFESCDGDSWNENQNWMSTASICTWTGIQCTDGSKDGGIEAIELGGNNIVGSPPTELFTLPSLTSLALYSNPLKLVDFSGIEFATNLKELLLDATGISSVAGLERAPSLEILNLRFNQLKSGLPSEIAALTTLHTLTMAYNEMTGRLPPFLEALTNLKSLLLSSNSLSGSLRGVNFPASLRRLDLSQNSFTGPIPDSFLSLVHFQAQLEIDLSGNAFTGSLPTDLTRFNSLSFYASDTKIMKIDSQLCFMKNWNNGDVGKYGCDAILCPAGHSGPNGRHSSAGACRKCPNAGSEFMGSTTCELTSSVNGHVLPRFAVGASFALGCIFRLIL